MSVKTLRVCLWWVRGSLDTLQTVVRVPAPTPHRVADGTGPEGQVLCSGRRNGTVLGGRRTAVLTARVSEN